MPSARELPVYVALALSFAFAGSPALAQQHTFAPEQQQGMIAGICLGQIPIGEEGCACLAERAMTALSDAQRDYLLLTVVDPVNAQKLPMAGSQDDLAAIFTFLETTSAECAPGAPATAPDAGDGAGEAGQN
jgi:hypothetical protein